MPGTSLVRPDLCLALGLLSDHFILRRQSVSGVALERGSLDIRVNHVASHVSDGRVICAQVEPVVTPPRVRGIAESDLRSSRRA